MQPIRLACLTVLAAALVGPPAARAACLAWVPPAGEFTVRQSNDITVAFRLSVRGTQVSGTAAYAVPADHSVGLTSDFRLQFGRFGYTNHGTVQGNLINGTFIEMRVLWETPTGHTGYYAGDINGLGQVLGTNYRVGAPASVTRWTTQQPFTCVLRDATPFSIDVVKPGAGSAAARVLSGGPIAAAPERAVPSATEPAAAPAPYVDPRTCKPGYVWRTARPTDLVCVTPESRARVANENALAAQRVQPGGGAYGPDTCRTGFVWREAFAGDHVCVAPAVRAAVAEENRLARSTRSGPVLRIPTRPAA